MALVMNWLARINGLLRPAQLSRQRMLSALFVALAADGLQLLFQPAPGVPEMIDVVAMVLTVGLLGFHVLLLPTFVIEFIHFVDALPTWTACVLAVIALRRREEKSRPPVQQDQHAKPPMIPLPSSDQKLD